MIARIFNYLSAEKRRQNIAGIFILLVFFIIFFYSNIFGNRCLNVNSAMWFDSLYLKDKPLEARRIFLGDFTPVIMSYPYDYLAAQEFREGRLPLWNSYNGCGAPVLADFQSAPFSVFKILFYIYPSQKTYDFYYMSVLLSAGIFTFLFLRQSGASALASIFGAETFMFNQYMLLRLSLTDVPVIAFLPLLLLFTERIFIKGWSQYFTITIAMLLAISSGHPEVAFYVFAAGFLYGLYMIMLREKDLRVQNFIKFIKIYPLAGLTTLLSYSAVIFPFVEFLKNGWTHKFGAADLSPLTFLIHSAALVSYLLQPLFLKIPIAITEYFVADYMGVVVLLLGVAGLTAYSWRVPSFVLVLFFLPVFNIIGVFTGIVFRHLYTTPVFILGMIMYAVRVMDGMDDQKELLKKIKISFIILFILSFVFAMPVTMDILKRSGIRMENYPLYFLSRAHSLLFIWMPLSVFLWSIHKIRKTSLVKALFIFFAFLDLFLVSKFTHLRNQCFEYYLPEHLGFLKPGSEPFRVLSLKGAPLPANTNLVPGIFDIRHAEAISLRRYGEFLSAVDPSMTETGKMIPHSPEVLFWDLLNVKYLLTSRCTSSAHQTFCGEKNVVGIYKPPEITDGKFRMIVETEYYRIYENLFFMPRAFLVATPIFVNDERESLMMIKEGWKDFRNSVIIEEKDSKSIEEIKSKVSAGVRDGVIEFIYYGTQKVKLQVKASSPGFVVLSDAYYPGWKAFVDGVETKIFPADYFIRAVFVDKGEHILEFRYEPLSFRIGMIISLVTLTVFAGMLIKKNLLTSI